MLTGPSVIALEVSGGVDGPVLDHHFKMKMAASGVTGRSDSAYPSTLAQGLTLRNADAGQVVVRGLQALAVVNYDPVSAAVRAPACLRYLSRSCSQHGRVACPCEIKPGMHFAGGTGQGIAAEPKCRTHVHRGERRPQACRRRGNPGGFRCRFPGRFGRRFRCRFPRWFGCRFRRRFRRRGGLDLRPIKNKRRSCLRRQGRLGGEGGRCLGANFPRRRDPAWRGVSRGEHGHANHSGHCRRNSQLLAAAPQRRHWG